MNERDLFVAALEIADPAARRAFLDQACAGDPHLRSRIEVLLSGHAAAGEGFLSTPAMQPFQAQPSSVDDRPSSADGSSEFEKTHGYARDAGQADDDVSLEFLSPSEKPGSLGQLGHYEVRQVLGRGAFGVVLKAFDEKLHRMVAIKVLSPELAKASPPRKRFLREARSAAAIRHEHVVAIYAVEEQPLPYLVMEYIPGTTLEQALHDHGPLDVDEVLRLGQQIAAGLAAAHAQGLIHRDIKPSNILLENALSGKVKISDFGLARAADDASLTQSGLIAGTPMYMSPEQATSGDIDQRSDLFSLGSVLYVMVSGRPPFRAANTLAVLKRVVEDTPRPIPSIIAEVPDWLCAIIAKLHAKKPEDRFATAQEVADLLGKCLADLQANRPVQLPVGMQTDVEKPAQTAAPIAPLIASEDIIPDTPALSHPRTSARRAWPTIAAAALILLAGLGITEATGVTQLASTVIRLTTGSGTLVIETDDPGVKVTIDGEEVSIQGAGVEQLTLKPGRYKIAAVKDGKPVSQELVTITRGGKEVVRVTMEGIAVTSTVSRDPTGSALSSTDPDRRAAEWVLSIGGSLQIAQDGVERDIRVVADLPAKRFEVTSVFLGGNDRVSDDELARFKECKGLRRIQIHSTPISDVGLSHFRNCQSLTLLRLSEMPQITDEGLAYFSHCRELEFLELNNNHQLTDAGLFHFRQCKKLKTLYLAVGGNVTDVGIANFENCEGLKRLDLRSNRRADASLRHFKSSAMLESIDLRGSQVSDEGLEILGGFSSLRDLALEGTKVSEAGIQELAVALPRCVISWDGGVIEPTMTADPDRTAAEWVLSIGGTITVDKVVNPIQKDERLPTQAFELRTVKLHRPIPEIDEGLKAFRGCRNLVVLELGSTNVTDAGLANFQDCKKLWHLVLQGTNVSDAGLAHFRGCSELVSLQLGGTRVRGAGLQHFANCEHIGTLYLNSTDCGNEGLAHLKNWQELVNLDLSGTQVTDQGIAFLAGCRELKQLNLTDTLVSNQGLARIKSDRLTHLRLARMQVTDDGLANFQDCRELQVLELDGLKISDAGLKHFPHNPDLDQLRVTSELVTDAGLKPFAGCTKLTGLYVNNTQLTDDGLAAFQDCKQLVNLNLDKTRITDAGLSHLQNFPDLRQLVLIGTRTSDAGLLDLAKLANLRDLRLEHTKLTESGVTTLHERLPQCRIEWNGGVVDPVK